MTTKKVSLADSFLQSDVCTVNCFDIVRGEYLRLWEFSPGRIFYISFTAIKKCNPKENKKSLCHNTTKCVTGQVKYVKKEMHCFSLEEKGPHSLTICDFSKKSPLFGSKVSWGFSIKRLRFLRTKKKNNECLIFDLFQKFTFVTPSSTDRWPGSALARWLSPVEEEVFQKKKKKKKKKKKYLGILKKLI